MPILPMISATKTLDKVLCLAADIKHSSFVNGRYSICSDVIVDYTINNNGEVTSDKYATQQYIENKGYVTNDSLDTKLEAFKMTMQEYVEDYVETTVSLLIRHIVSEEISSRYSTNQDIQDLFN